MKTKIVKLNKRFSNYILGKKPKSNLAMHFGSCIHKGLEVFYKTGNEEAAENAFIKEFSAAKIELKPKESMEREGKMGVKMLKKYFSSIERPYFDVKEVEYKFDAYLSHPITGEKIKRPFRMILDLITKDDFIVDHKTSSSFWSEQDLDENMQASCYWLGFLSHFGKEPTGFVFNFFIKRVNEPKFDAQAVERDIGQLTYFVEHANYVIEQIEKGNFPKNVGSRCRHCPYRYICL